MTKRTVNKLVYILFLTIFGAPIEYSFAVDSSYGKEISDNENVSDADYENDVLTEQDIELDYTFMSGGGGLSKDYLDSLSKKYPPGRYLVEVRLNNEKLGKSIFSVDKSESETKCFGIQWLQDVGIFIDENYYKSLYNYDRSCYSLSKNENTIVKFDFENQTLDFSIPQVGIRKKSKVTKFWDFGTDALRLNYNVNANTNSFDELVTYGAFDFLANIDKWRAKASLSVTDNKSNLSNAYITRAYREIQSDLSLGKLYVNNGFAGGASMLGASLVSNNSMRPEEIGYTPVFSGVALTLARVTLVQNGYTVYSEMVPAGPFEITNVNLLNSGDITMVVTESDGSRTVKLFPLTVVSNMLSPGKSEYGAYLGIRDDEWEKDLSGLFAAANYGYGFNQLTFRSNLLVHNKYANASLGVSSALGNWGTLSLDSAYSYAKYDWGKTKKGSKLSLTYAKTFNKNTNMQLIGAQYTSNDYVDFSNFMP